MKTFLSVILTICCLAGAAYLTPPDGVRLRFRAAQSCADGSDEGRGCCLFPTRALWWCQIRYAEQLVQPSFRLYRDCSPGRSIHPALGIAIGFEFDEDNGDYPYTPAHAVLQLKDFGWGGMEFSVLDTMNYTGVSNDISDDLFIEVDGFQHDTVWGRFSGVLVSGAGKMASIDEGTFRVRVQETVGLASKSAASTCSIS